MMAAFAPAKNFKKVLKKNESKYCKMESLVATDLRKLKRTGPGSLDSAGSVHL